MAQKMKKKTFDNLNKEFRDVMADYSGNPKPGTAEFMRLPESERRALIQQNAPSPIEQQGQKASRFKGIKKEFNLQAKRGDRVAGAQKKFLSILNRGSTSSREKGIRNLGQQFVNPVYRNRIKPAKPSSFVKRQGDLAGLNNSTTQENRAYLSSEYQKLKEAELSAAYQKSMKISENTANILARVRTIQNRSRIADMEQTRRTREKKILSDAMNILRTPNIFSHKESLFDPTGVSSDNILMAPNVFKESPNNPNILDTRGRPTILDVNSTGNNIMARRPDSINIMGAPNIFQVKRKYGRH